MVDLDYEAIESLILYHVCDADVLDSVRVHGLHAGGDGGPITMGLYAFVRRPNDDMLDSIRDRLAGLHRMAVLRFTAPEGSTWFWDTEYPEGERLAVLSQDCGVIPWDEIDLVEIIAPVPRLPATCWTRQGRIATPKYMVP